jgi:salicylate hydroxylase
MYDSDMTQYRILIAGAGIGGLAAASCLMKAGHKVEIHEQAPQLGEIGAGIQVSANAMHVLRHLGLEPAVVRVGVEPGAYVFRLHDTGEEIQRFSLSEEHERLHGAPYRQLHRADLHDILANRAREADPGVVRLNHAAVGFTESADEVELHFADGSSARGDLLRYASSSLATPRRPTPAMPPGACWSRRNACRKTCWSG